MINFTINTVISKLFLCVKPWLLTVMHKNVNLIHCSDKVYVPIKAKHNTWSKLDTSIYIYIFGYQSAPILVLSSLDCGQIMGCFIGAFEDELKWEMVTKSVSIHTPPKELGVALMAKNFLAFNLKLNENKKRSKKLPVLIYCCSLSIGKLWLLA